MTEPDSPWLDSARLTFADGLIAAAAGLFLIWSLVPVWYEFLPGGIPVEGFDLHVSAWHGITVTSGVLAALGVSLVLLRMGKREVRIGRRTGAADLAVAMGAETLTLLGLLVQPSFFEVSWGLYVGIALGLAWIYAAYRKVTEPPRGEAPIT